MILGTYDEGDNEVHNFTQGNACWLPTHIQTAHRIFEHRNSQWGVSLEVDTDRYQFCCKKTYRAKFATPGIKMEFVRTVEIVGFNELVTECASLS